MYEKEHEESLNKRLSMEVYGIKGENGEGAMPENYIEERKQNISMQSLNDSQIKRQNRFRRPNNLLMSYGNSPERRRLESSERKRQYVLGRSHSESKFGQIGHSMPRPSHEKMNRSFSESRFRLRELQHYEEN